MEGNEQCTMQWKAGVTEWLIKQIQAQCFFFKNIILSLIL